MVHAAVAQLRPIDPSQSSATVHVFKSGMFSAFGHNHEVAAPVSGTIDESARAVELTVNASDLKVLDPDRPADERAQVQAIMLGPQVLDVQRFPTIHFRSISVRQDSKGGFAIRGELTLHGVTKPVDVQVTHATNDRYHATAVLKQTDFGITPVAVAGGTVKVKDEVKLDFVIMASQSGSAATRR
jgi:polyisoprenoid-binding protein YceI